MVVVEQCDGMCWICEQDVDLTLHCSDPMSASMDHLIPREEGGAYAPENLLLSHRRCNEERYREDQS
jgi:5-methylcytosine-specific restriction endonuclease McrA